MKKHKNDLHNEEKRQYENRAISILQHIFPAEFSEIVKSEHPDFIGLDNSIGIEVTQAINEKRKESDRYFFEHLLNKSPSQKEIEKYNGDSSLDIIDGTIVSSTTVGYNEIDDILKTLDKKYKKLNQPNYKLCKTNILYVFIDLFTVLFNDKTIEEITAGINQIQKGFTNRFQVLYFEYQQELFKYEVEFDRMSVFSIPEELFAL